MSLYCWGNTAHGELGLGGIEDEQIFTPRKMDWSQAPEVISAASGTMHTLLLTKSGQLYSCGSNDHGQLGHDMSRKRPRTFKFKAIAAFENYKITKICCGAVHSMALDEWGQLYSWGSNAIGQLGNDTSIPNHTPKPIKALATKHIVQIASGHYHSLALTNTGELYSWGSNGHGQLGLGTTSEKSSTPCLISSLVGIPIAFIACGGNHCFAVSKSGSVYGWGKNLFGQLGVNDNIDKVYPTHLKSIRSLGVRFVACGDDFTVFLTSDGRVFSTGAGTYGQLGHGSVQNDYLPRMVAELMGTVCTQISTGRRHTLTFVPSRGRVYGFGLGCSGQLGNRSSNNSSIPQVVMGPWVSPSGTSLIDNDENQENIVVYSIFSGGDQSFVSTVKRNDNIIPADFRIYDPATQIMYFSENVAEICSKVGKNDTIDMDLMSNLEVIFKSQACFNASFLMNAARVCSKTCPGINIEEAEKSFEYVRKIENETLRQIIFDGISNNLISSLQPSPADIETLRIYLTLPLYHEFVNSKHYQILHTPFSKSILSLTDVPQKIVLQWWCNQSSDYFERLVNIFKGVVSYIIDFNIKGKSIQSRTAYEANLKSSLDTMRLLFRSTHKKYKVPSDIFHIPDLIESIDLSADYINWLMNKSDTTFHFCNYPFLFDAKAKTLLLETDQYIQMGSAINNATNMAIFSLFSGNIENASPYIFLNVSRENLVQDTIREIMQYNSGDLKKPLKVKFHGEEAEDAGGVRKEFFMLLLKDLLDPKYGMFKEYEDSRTIWFSDHSFEEPQMYMLIGILVGLAIYNFTIINLPFPLCLYKKLLNEPVDISDLRDLSPTLANSMQSILDYKEDDMESVFGLYFEITREIFGQIKTVLLDDNGDKIPVTQENKEKFVTSYIRFVISTSVEKQFESFRRGFLKVCGGRVLELFQASELMSVVIGNEDYDWHALEAGTEYKNGYSSSHQTILWFWEVFHDLPLNEKKKFLLFLTGSDRIPIQGMKAIKIIIQPVKDEKFLPVAHTCFNLLDLPIYKTKERLRYKLCQAIQQTQGFSLV